MTHLKIEQNNNVEVVGASLIQKLYETALATPDITLAGNLQCEHCYLSAYEYLTGSVNDVKRFPNLTINCTGGLYIEFEDPIVQQICVSKWGDGVGITPSQAAAVNNSAWGKTFENNTEITKFNEFVYFTGLDLNRWDNNIGFFFGCTNLTEITIPKNIKVFGSNKGPFSDCVSLVKVNYDQEATITDAPTFINCPSLQSPLIFPDSCTTISSDVIRSSSGGTLQNIHTIVVGTNVTSINPTSNGIGQTYNLDYIIQTTTPPTLTSTWWTGGKITFYVPDAALNDYKAAPAWSDISDHIKGISEYSGTEWTPPVTQ